MLTALLAAVGLALVAFVAVPNVNAAGGSLSAQALVTRSATVTVPKSTPSISQTASAGGPAGTTGVTDQATLTGGTSNATGTLTFRLWSDTSCTVQVGSSSVIAVAGATNTSYTSGSITPALAGTDRWTVSYSGDANNTAVSSTCGASGTSVVITPALLAYSAVGAPTSATSNVTSAVAYPSGTVANDLVFLIEVNAFGGASTTPTGWTQLVNQSTNSPAKLTLRVWSKLSAGETSVSLAFKSGAAGSTAWVVRYNRSSGYPPNPTSATATVQSGIAGATATLTPTPDLTTNVADARVISIAVLRSANPVSLSTAQSFQSRLLTTNTPVGGAAVSLAVADQLKSAVGSVVSPTWSQTGTAAQWAWATVAWS